MKYVQADIQSLLSFIFKKLSDIVASFINTGQMQYCVLPTYFLALCLPLLFCVSIFKIQTKHLLRKSQRKSRQNSRQPTVTEEFKFLKFEISLCTTFPS